LRNREADGNPSRFAPTQLLFAHAAIADPRHGKLRHDQRIAPREGDIGRQGQRARLGGHPLEVREKRGLCYSVYASHEGMKDRGTIVGYSGTRPERAQETLDVMLAEFRKLRDGVHQDEIDRTKAGLKSSLIMQQESTSARASSLARDWFQLGRVTTLEEIRREVESLTAERVNAYAAKYGPQPLTSVTIGIQPLK